MLSLGRSGGMLPPGKFLKLGFLRLKQDFTPCAALLQDDNPGNISQVK